MRPSNKSRSRNNKNNNRNQMRNVVNRVFHSAGPEGKVNGTPQQIIEKYGTAARDAQLSGDPVAAENFMQHSEHYTRMLNEAQRQQAEQQREEAERREAQADQQPQPQQQIASPPRDDAAPVASQPEPQPQPQPPERGAEALPVADGGADLVETPEDKAEEKPKRSRSRSRRRRTDAGDEASQGSEEAQPAE